ATAEPTTAAAPAPRRRRYARRSTNRSAAATAKPMVTHAQPLEPASASPNPESVLLESRRHASAVGDGGSTDRGALGDRCFFRAGPQHRQKRRAVGPSKVEL